MPGPRRLRRMQLGSLLKHDMSVRSADTESTDASAARTVTGFPFRSLASNPEWTVLKIEVWVRSLEMKRRWKHAMPYDMRRIDQAGHAGSDIQMPDIGLRRTYRAKLLSVRSCSKSLAT